MSGWLATVLDVAGYACLLAAALLTLAAGVGVVRFGDLLQRLHAATKPQSLGVSLAFVGLALILRTGWTTWALLLLVIFQFGTAPVAAHMLARAGMRIGLVPQERLEVNEMEDDAS